MSDIYDDDALSTASTVEAIYNDNDDDALSTASTVEAIYNDNDDDLDNVFDMIFPLHLNLNNSSTLFHYKQIF